VKCQSAGARANGPNATPSTGPRTPEGKARASRNSQKHGLASAISSLPSWVARRAELAQWIRETYADLPAELIEEIAAAHVDLERVYNVQEAIWEEILAGKVESKMQGGARQAPTETAVGESRKNFEEAVDRLGKIARYERRARSRRNKALRTALRMRCLREAY
jgi:hypothetical protein